jgi:hypothetical protein
MFAHIRKHQQWLFILIISVVVVSFVIFFTPSVQYDNLGSSGASDVMGSIDGRPVARKEFVNAYQEVMLRFLMATGQWPDQTDSSRFGFDPEQETPSRLLLLDKAKEHGIQISDEAVAKWIVTSFKDPATNEFRRELYDGMMTNGLAQRRMTEEDFQRFAKNQIAVSQLSSIVGMTGELVSPREAELLYREESLQANTQIVFFSSTNHANLGQNLDGLAAFYTNRMALYRNPVKRTINYLKFSSTNYLAEAETTLSTTTNLTEMADLIYTERGSNSFLEAGVVLSKELALEQIKEQELTKIGLTVAKEKALEFARELFDIEPMKGESLPEMATAKGLTALISEPFTENQLIPNLGVQYQLTRQSFQLTEEEPFTTPFLALDGVYLVSLNSVIPSEVPPLDEIRGRVTVDFYQQQSLEDAREAANAFHTTLTTQLAEGKTFEAICDEAGHTRVQMPLFALNSQTQSGDQRADISTLKNLAFALENGDVSQVSSTRDGAMILHLNSFVTVREEDLESELPDYVETLRRTRRSEAFSEWLVEGQATMNFATAADDTEAGADDAAAN